MSNTITLTKSQYEKIMDRLEYLEKAVRSLIVVIEEKLEKEPLWFRRLVGVV